MEYIHNIGRTHIEYIPKINAYLEGDLKWQRKLNLQRMQEPLWKQV